ncbi:MAG: transcription elongation factor GreA [Acidimicrobiales bacterium]
MTANNELSQEAYNRLSQEHKDLSTRGRIDIAQRIEEARLHGDLSENAEYHSAKEEQGKMEARISQLAGLLEDVTIVESSGQGSVSTGNQVEIRYHGDSETEILLYGPIEERVGGLTVVSPGSPLGIALDGAKIGDKVSFESPVGELSVEIVAITI